MRPLNLKITILSVLITLTSSLGYAQSCKFVTENFQTRVQKKFKQNPVRLIETFTNTSHKLFLEDIDSLSSAKKQNTILVDSFDVNKINQSILKNLKTRSVTRYFMDWVRTQYWGSIHQLYYNKEVALKSFSKDLLAPHEIEITNTHPVMAKISKLSSRKCYDAEKNVGICPGTIYEAHVQFSPLISCRQSILEKPFKGKFLLSYKKNQGFKIIDVELSGKRIVLPALAFLTAQKRKGLNSQALITHLKLLSANAGSFSMPETYRHSNNFLAKYNTATPRLPASL